MSTRQKIIIAMVVVGMFCLIVWRVVLLAPPGVTIQFSRYETNHYAGLTYGSMPSGQVVFAVFVVTNGTGHSIHCVSNSGTATWESARAATPRSTTVMWGAGAATVAPVAPPNVNPSANGRIFMAVKDFRQPLRAWVEYEEIPRPGSLRARVPGWLRWPKWHRAISVTIQDD
jgi:hypothetical protein